MTKQQTAERDEAIAKLREWIKPGDTVYTILRHVSRSGMQRSIGIVLIAQGDDGQPFPLFPIYAAAKALGRRINADHEGITCNGGGMDMGFELVYNLSAVLYGDGYALKHRWI